MIFVDIYQFKRPNAYILVRWQFCVIAQSLLENRVINFTLGGRNEV